MTDKKKSQTQAHIDIIRSKTEEPKKVLIVIHGGCAYLNEKPLSVEVEIRDYDVINIDAIDDDRCKKDEDGDWYQEMLWESIKEISE